MTWNERYRQAHNNWVKAKSPSFYEISGGDKMLVQFPKVTSSNGLTTAIIKFLEWSGHHAERINNMGRPVDRRKEVTNILGHTRVIGSLEWQKGNGRAGTADIHADLRHENHRFPIPVKIEVKWNKDQMRDAQRQYQAEIESRGGVYVVIKSIQGFFEWYDEFLSTL